MRSTLPRPTCDDLALSDHLTKSIVSRISLSNQHFLRDSGWFRSIVDFCASLALSVYYLTHPSLSLYVHSIKRRYRLITISNDTKLHVFHFASKSNRNRLVLFVHGGAWGSGSPELYFAITKSLSVLFNVVIFLQYPTYPDSDLTLQVSCLSDAISIIHHQPSLFVDNKCDIDLILCGHSSGAHLIYKLLSSSLSSMVSGFISLSGVFDTQHHYLYESLRGVQELSPMKPAVLDIDKQTEAELAIETPSLLIHGLVDNTVPFYSTVKVSSQFKHVSVKFIENCSHMETIVQLANSGNEIIGIIRKWLISTGMGDGIDMRSKL